MTFSTRLITLAVFMALLLPPAFAATTLPAGANVAVRLQQTVSSDDSTTGQEFKAVLDEALVSNGRQVAPKGATVIGKVTQARKSGRLKTPAALYLRLTAIEIGGQRHVLATSSVGGTHSSHKKRNVGLIGGGAGLGAAIGAIAGGGAGAAIGAAAGAGAGTATAAATGKKDIVYPVETRLVFRLSRPLIIP